MSSKGKQVVMSYEEHQQLLLDKSLHAQEISSMADKMAKQEEIMEKLIEERDDIVVIEKARMMVEKNWKLRPGYGIGYTDYESRYVNFPRFIGGDELAKELDQGFVEMHGEIRNLQAERNDMEAGRKKDRIDFEKMNKAIPINVWNTLSKRRKERIRGWLHQAHQKLAKEEKR